MPYAKQATSLFFLMLFLQGSNCSNGKLTSPSISLPPQVVDTHFESTNPTKMNAAPGPIFDAKFYIDPDFNSNPKPDPHSGYDSGYDSDNNSDSKLVPQKKSLPPFDATKDNLRFDFEHQIESMRQHADDNRNIKWDLSGDQLTRVVNNNESNTGLYASEDYVVIGLNIYRAAKKISELYGQHGSEFEDKAQQLIQCYFIHSEKPEDVWIKTVQDINKEVLLYLQKKLFQGEDLNAINEKLRLAENYVGLDDTHYNVTTTFHINGKKLGLEDKKWFPLTEKQKRSYKNRQSEKWYTRLSSFQQKFIDAYVDKFLDGKHYIPTQLRSILGCRNAYQKRILTYDQNNNPIVLGGYYHSGSLPSPIEWEDKATDFEITKDNWEQVIKQNKNLEVISLNYNMNLPAFKQAREKKIVEDTKKVVGNDRFMNLSINGIGTSSNLNNQYDKLIKEMLVHYKQKYPDLCATFAQDDPKQKSYLKKIHSFFNKNVISCRENAIEKIQNPKDKIFFKTLVALEKPAKESQVWSNVKQTMSISDNPNANTAANYIACKSFLNTNKPTFPVLFSCKSGKDRTGLISYSVDRNIIDMSGLLPFVENSKLYKTLARSGHYQILASINGGMPGRFGMKSVKLNEASREFMEQLFPKAAHFTTIPLVQVEDDNLGQEKTDYQESPSKIATSAA